MRTNRKGGWLVYKSHLEMSAVRLNGRRQKHDKKYQHTVLETGRNEVVGYSLVVPPIAIADVAE